MLLFAWKEKHLDPNPPRGPPNNRSNEYLHIKSLLITWEIIDFIIIVGTVGSHETKGIKTFLGFKFYSS
jgi:hypothetical protein